VPTQNTGAIHLQSRYYLHMAAQYLRSAVLSLSREERAELAHDLLRSLDEARDSEVETAWLREITRRAKEVAEGAVQAVDWEAARLRIAQRLEARRREA
jgi:putative addiction module component (TIGR02574 family)